MSIGDISLTSSMSNNLAALTRTATATNQTQQRLSTGKKVNSPVDDPTNFFAAQSLLGRADNLASSKDAITTSIQTANSATAGIEGISSLLQSAKAIATAYQTSTNPQEQADFASSYQSLISQAGQIATDSGNGTAVTSVLPSGSLTATSPGELDSAVSSLRQQSEALSANLSNTSTINNFTDAMINTLKTGSDNLTLGDMNQEGANMLMLQTRQQLGTASLGMSSQAAQSVLRLF